MRIEAAPETIPKAIQLILDNQDALKQYGIEEPTYTPPGGVAEHYLSMYKWDSFHTSIVLAEHGYLEKAKTEFNTVYSTMDPVTGFISNMNRFVKRPAWKEIEWLTFDNSFKSNYSQPAMGAEAAGSIYDAYERSGDPKAGEEFLKENFAKLDLSYSYWRKCRQYSPANPLVFVIHSNETGRDSCPTFDRFKYRLPRNGVDTSWIINAINPALDFSSSINNNRKNMANDWDPEKIRPYFEVKDVMFNCIYHKNLSEMARIAGVVGNEEKMLEYQELADRVEQAIITQMWDPMARGGKGAFYSLHKGEHIYEDVAANLYPLLLPNLPKKQLMACLDQILKDFNTPFPVPTVATSSRNFDPHYKEKGIMWRGPVWQWINRGLRLGLRTQTLRDNIPDYLKTLCADLAEWIEDSSHELVEGTAHENHDPYTGEGYRTPRFAGAASGYRLPSGLIVVS